MHIPPIKGTAQVTCKVVDGTEPTLSMSMLAAIGHRLVCRGEDTMLSTAAGEVVPLTSDGDDWYLEVLINNENVFIRIDVWAAYHECPPSWVSMLEPGERGKENHTSVNNNHQDTQRFQGEEQFEPRTNWSCGKPRNTQMLEDVDELMLAKPWCDHAESAIPPLEETDFAAAHCVFFCAEFILVTVSR